MGMDPLQIAQHVEVQRAGLDGFGPARPQPFQMAVRGRPLQIAEPGLFHDQAAGDFDLAGQEDAEAELHMLDHPVMQSGDLGLALSRKAQPVLDLLRRQLHQVLVDDVADMFKVCGEADDLEAAPALLLVQFLAAYRGEKELQLLVQRVDHVVGPLHILQHLAVVGRQHLAAPHQHAFHHVAHAQRLARGAGERDRRLVQGRAVEIAGLARVFRQLALGQHPLTKRRHQIGQADKHHREAKVEGGVEVDHLARRLRLELGEVGCRYADQGHGDRNADHAEQQVAERHPAGRRAGADQQRRDGAAGVGAQHQQEGQHDRHRAGRSERHDQQHHRQAGMGKPGQQPGDQHRQQRLAGERGDDRLHHLRLAHRRAGADDQAERQQHQAEPDRHPAEIAQPRHPRREEGHDAAQNQQRR